MDEVWRLVANSLQQAPWGWALLATAIIALIKIWPALHLQTVEARARLRKEKRDELIDCQRRMDEMTETINRLSDEVSNFKVQLSGVLAAYRIVEIECEASNPNSIGLAQARAVLSAAFTIAPSTGTPRLHEESNELE